MGLTFKSVLVAALIATGSFANANVSKRSFADSGISAPSKASDPQMSRTKKAKSAAKNATCPLRNARVTASFSADKTMEPSGSKKVESGSKATTNTRRSS